jgi:hypothetical protein
MSHGYGERFRRSVVETSRIGAGVTFDVLGSTSDFNGATDSAA